MHLLSQKATGKVLDDLQGVIMPQAIMPQLSAFWQEFRTWGRDWCSPHVHAELAIWRGQLLPLEKVNWSCVEVHLSLS